MDKRGEMGLNKIIMIAFIVGALMFIVFLIGVLAPVASTTFGAFGDAITNTPNLLSLANTPQANDSARIVEVVQSSEGAVSSWQYLPYMMFGIAVICFIVFAVNIKVHPVLSIVWIILIAVIVIISIPLSNTYSYLADHNPSVYGGQDALSNLYLRNLPIVFTAFGLIGGIFLFILSTQEPEFEVSTQ